MKFEQEFLKNRNVKKTLITAIPALAMPVIILGGIYGGIFTPSEAASVAAAVALLIGIFVYKTLDRKSTVKVLKNSANSIGGIFMMIFVRLPERISWFRIMYSDLRKPVYFLINLKIFFCSSYPIIFPKERTSLLWR